MQEIYREGVNMFKLQKTHLIMRLSKYVTRITVNSRVILLESDR